MRDCRMQNETDKMVVTVVMPALNEEKNIAAAIDNTLQAFKDFSIEGEIVVVNDGSTDETENIINDIVQKKERCVRLLKHDTPKGIGASFWDGVDNARGNIIV